MMLARQIGGLAAALLVSFILAGCGGGASAEPTVSLKLDSETAVAVAPGAAAADGAAEQAAAEGFGTFRGRVVLSGGAPDQRILFAQGAAPKDQAVCGAHAIPDQSLVVNDGGIANVFIYLDKAPANTPAASSELEPVVFDQEFCVFLPHALVVRTGQVVRVLNSDPILHNTHTFPVRNSGFNQAINRNEQQGVPLVYSRPEREPFSVGCDIHPWMLAYHLPLDHPYAAVTAEDGSFEIANLPSGTYEFQIWQEKAKFLDKKYKVTIKADETTEVEIPFAGDRFAARDAGPTKTLLISSAR